MNEDINERLDNIASEMERQFDGMGAELAAAAKPAQADWNNTNRFSPGCILNRPNLSTVATTGSYNDLTDKPALKTVATTGSYYDLSNRPSIPAPQVQADWDESDSDAAGYILGNPSKVLNSSFSMWSRTGTTNLLKMSIPGDATGNYTFGNISSQKTSIIGGTIDLISQHGSIYFSGVNGINFSTGLLGVRLDSNSQNTAGGFAVVGSTGKLPASIIPDTGGSSYDNVQNGTLESGGRYLLDYATRSDNQNSFSVNFSSSDDIEFHVLVEDQQTEYTGNPWRLYIGGYFEFGYGTTAKLPPNGLYKYKVKYNGVTCLLTNESGNVIAAGATSLYGDGPIAINVNSGSLQSYQIPLSNNYMLMPFGGQATPIDCGPVISPFSTNGISASIDFSDSGISSKYLHLFGRNPVFSIGNDTTITNFKQMNTVNDRVTFTFVGGSGSHLYMDGADSTDLMSGGTSLGDGNSMVRITTWCEYAGSYWTRYFQDESTGTVWYQTKNTLPYEN